MAAKKGKVIFSIDITADQLYLGFKDSQLTALEDNIYDILSQDSKLSAVLDSHQMSAKVNKIITPAIKAVTADDLLSQPGSPAMLKSLQAYVRDGIQNCIYDYVDFNDNAIYAFNYKLAEIIVKRIRPQLEPLATVSVEQIRKDEQKEREIQDRKQLKALIKKYGVPKK